MVQKFFVRKFFIVRLFCCLILLLNLLSLTVFSLDLPQPTKDFFVNDFANILNSETKELIMAHSVELMEKTSAQVVVTTVDSLQGEALDDYSQKLARNWKIGSETNNGVLILLAPNERKTRVDVGYGLEGALNDSKVGRYIDNYAIPEFKNDNWNSGIKNLYIAIIRDIYVEYDIEFSEDMTALPEIKNKYYVDKVAERFQEIIVFIVILVIFFYINKRREYHHNRWWYFFDNHFFGGGWPFGGDSNGSSGGFFGGGDSDGGGFSGGGGSFGGGGASRGF